MHMGDPKEKAWIRDRIEGPGKDISFTINGKKMQFLTKWFKQRGLKNIFM